ncbi:hypothetical protein N0V90_009861 [Kalmusia sp. IMI 367209]|nr:hypothetical protein N0V90_009861 [Kalmusia sp. IMI 367209]
MALEEKITALETRIEFETARRPVVDHERFLAWQENLRPVAETDKITARVVWRRKRKIAAASQKEEEKRKESESKWQARILELELTLNRFKTHLARLDVVGERTGQKLRELAIQKEQLQKQEARLLETRREDRAARLQRLAARKASREGRDQSAADPTIIDLTARREALNESIQRKQELYAEPQLYRNWKGKKSLQQKEGGTKTQNSQDGEAQTEKLQARQEGQKKPLPKTSSEGQQTQGDVAKEANADPRLSAMMPKPKELIVETRLHQLQDISQSVSILKKVNAKSQPSAASAATTKVEEMLRGLERDISDPSPREAEQQQEQQDEAKITPMAKPSIDRFENEDPGRAPKKDAVFSESKQFTPFPAAWPEPQALETLSTLSLTEQLRAQLTSSDEVKIDADLTIDMEADVPDLQNQIFQLSKKLKSAYPMMDTLPYDVWTSNKRKTLQIWLKILVRKWQTRSDSVNKSAITTPDVSLDVRALLDQMVLDHDLDKQAAGRMVKRWAEIFERKEERRLGTELKESAEPVEEFDWDEHWDTGLGWLRDEVEAMNKAITSEAAKPDFINLAPTVTNNDVLPEDVPFSWKMEKSQGYQKADTARGYCTLASKRHYSTSPRPPVNHKSTLSTKSKSPVPKDAKPSSSSEPTLPHLTPSGSAHMVSISNKSHTVRTAIAVGSVHFSNPTPLTLIRSNAVKKGDVLSVSRIAGIMAAKKCPDLVPLCHPIMLTHVGVDLHVFDEQGSGFGGVEVEARVQCEGQTGVEMEALTSVMGAALSVVDMCKAVDKGMVVQNVRVVLKEGGRSGTWIEEGWKSTMDKDREDHM